MKINDVSRAPTANDTAPAAKPSGSGAAGKTTSATAAVGSVNISEASRSLQAAGTSNAEAPFDAKRVDAIKAAISSGQFKVNPEAIADKVLNSASQLLVGKS
jgi:negative regulator of flagellin synthesis FlgM